MCISQISHTCDLFPGFCPGKLVIYVVACRIFRFLPVQKDRCGRNRPRGCDPCLPGTTAAAAAPFSSAAACDGSGIAAVTIIRSARRSPEMLRQKLCFACRFVFICNPPFSFRLLPPERFTFFLSARSTVLFPADPLPLLIAPRSPAENLLRLVPSYHTCLTK